VNAAPFPRPCWRASSSACQRRLYRALGIGRKLMAASADPASRRDRDNLPRAQVQLLRVLDDGVVSRWERPTAQGGHPPSVRIQRDLSEEVRRGAIREDFYHRIMVLTIRSRRCASEQRTSRCLSPISSGFPRTGTPFPCPLFPRRRSRRCFATPGPATCGAEERRGAPGHHVA